MPVVRAIALSMTFLCATLAHAAAQRTFVASTGADTNAAQNCSLIAPCRSFAAAIGVTLAKGEVIVLDSAGYGPIASITKSVSITAPTGIYAGISVFTGDAITINAGSNDTVVLRGLTINGEGGTNGITITHALTVHVENCVIANMSIGINQSDATLDMKDTIVRNSSNIGVYVVGAKADLDRVRLEANNTGLAAEVGGLVAMQDSVVTGSGNIGVFASNTPATISQVTISRSLISFNNFGVYVDGAFGSVSTFAVAAVADSTISNNGVGVHLTSNSGGYHGGAHLQHNTLTANGTGVEIVNMGVAYIDGNYLYFANAKDLSADNSSLIYTSKNNMIGDATAPGTINPITPF